MQRYMVLVLLGLLALALGVNATLARQPYHDQFQKNFKDSKIAKAAQEAKCFNCHYGKTKKNRNDFGTALNKKLTEECYKQLKDNPDELAKKVKEALKAVMAEKSKSGKTFGELIDAGKLPGTAPSS